MNVRRTAFLTLTVATLGIVPAWSQTVIAGAAVEVGLQRFGGDPALNRLDGAALGGAIFGGVEVGPLVVRFEGWRDRAIDDRETTSVIANGKPATIQSSLAHDTHAVAVLASYAHKLSSRIKIAVGGGVSSVTIARTFTTDAGKILLVTPSTVPATDTTSHTVDRFATWNFGADVFVRSSERMRWMAALRTEPLNLQDDISGMSVRLLGGAVWTIR